MEPEAILLHLKKIIVTEMGLTDDEIHLDDHFLNDLGVDSLSLIDLLMLIEDEFEIEIPDTDAEGIATVRDAVDYIREHASGKTG